MLEACIGYCAQYRNDSSIVYKSCGQYIVILRKVEDTITNESRKHVIDSNYAKYRANKLRVLCIFKKTNPEIHVEAIQNTCYNDKKITYYVGRVVSVDNYDHTVESVCAPGIHYFKFVKAAYYYELPRNHTGQVSLYNEDGRKIEETQYVNGKEHGKYIEYHANGNKRIICEYKDGKEHGKYIEYHANGNKRVECNYVDGVKQ
jgi:hypothetical protein